EHDEEKELAFHRGPPKISRRVSEPARERVMGLYRVVTSGRRRTPAHQQNVRRDDFLMRIYTQKVGRRRLVGGRQKAVKQVRFQSMVDECSGFLPSAFCLLPFASCLSPPASFTFSPGGLRFTVE